MRPTTLTATATLALALVSLPALALAQEVCAPTDAIDRFRLLRQISLDLLGRIPTEGEYEAVRAASDVDAAVVDAMIESDDFYARLRRYHRQLLWGSLGDIEQVVNSRHRLRTYRLPSGDVWYSIGAGVVFRGANYVSCVDVEHTRFDAQGHALPLVEGYRSGPVLGAPPPRAAGVCEYESGCRIDGWVNVRPYWAPDTQVRVCAFDAQAVAEGLGVDASTGRAAECGPRQVGDRGCGCGPDLRYCLTEGPGGTDEAVRASLVEEPLRIFEAVVRSGSDYFEALRTPSTYVDGATAHYYHYAHASVTFESGLGDIPDLDWSDRAWHPVERDAHHSGVLTTLLYLLRFGSHRGRANRYYSAFLCSPFEASPDGLPAATDPCSSNPNLSERCGCASCHQTLEPAAAYWGRWRFNGTFGYRDEGDLPLHNAFCAGCDPSNCSSCNLNYLTPLNALHPDERELWGTLQVAAWRTDAERDAIDSGPAALQARPDETSALARCAARNMAEHLLGRELDAEEAGSWLPGLVGSFEVEEGRHDLRALVRAIVADSRYRAIR